MISLFILQRQAISLPVVNKQSIQIINSEAFQKAFLLIVVLIAAIMSVFTVLLFSFAFCWGHSTTSGYIALSLTVVCLILDAVSLIYLTWQFYKRVQPRTRETWMDKFHSKRALLVKNSVQIKRNENVGFLFLFRCLLFGSRNYDGIFKVFQ